MRRLPLILAASAAIGLSAAAYVRLAPMDAAGWHRDPETAQRMGRPNDWLLAPGGDAPAVASPDPPATLLARLDAVAMAEPRTERLAGSPGEGLISYVQRSAVLGFPDAVSVRAVPDGTGSRLSIWSRSRYGRSDFGVNRARVQRWLGKLDGGRPAS